MKSLIFLFCIVLYGQIGLSQELYGKFLDHQQGLLSQECYDITEDKDGYLLVSTQYGPMKYNGENFEPICMNLPIERRIIYDFEKAPDGTIYFVNSHSEIGKLIDEEAKIITPLNVSKITRLNRIIMLKLYCYNNNELIISTSREYYKFSLKTLELVELSKRKNHDNRVVYDSSAKNFPFERIFNYINLSLETTLEFRQQNTQLKYDISINPDSRDDQLIVGNKKFILLNSHLFLVEGNQVKDLMISNILFINHFYDRIWLSTRKGLLELDINGNIIYRHFPGFLIGGVVPINNNGIAVSFNQKGVFISPNYKDRIYHQKDITEAYFDGEKKIIGDYNGEIYQIDKENKLSHIQSLAKKIKPSDKEYLNSIKRIIKNQGLYYVLTLEGIYVYDEDYKLVKKSFHERNAFFDFRLIGEQFILFSRPSAFILHGKDLFAKVFPMKGNREIFETRNIVYVYEADSTTIWIGSTNGLFELNLLTQVYKKSTIFPKDVPISGVSKWKTFHLILSRYEGIYMIQRNKVTNKLNIPCISAKNIIVKKEHGIILGNDGVYIRNLKDLKKSTWIKLFEGEAKNIFCIDNLLLINYKGDLIIKELDFLDKKISKKEFLFRKVVVGKNEQTAKIIKVPNGQSIEIQFDILYYKSYSTGLFYILDNGKKIIQKTKNTTINFTALKSGKYTLTVYPIIDGKINYSTSHTFRFEIEKSFWESTAFIIILVILSLSIVVSFRSVYFLRKKKRLAEQSELESKMNEYKLLAVKAQVNPHFLSNGLAAIQALILKEENDLSAQYLAKFSLLMRRILDYSETQFISISKELQLVDSYLELELLRFRDRFKIQYDIQLTESQKDSFQFPSLLLQPIIENAIWHGLKFQENNPELIIQFYLDSDQNLVVKISDNGPGMNKSNQNEKHLSKGNKLISERIDALNKQFNKPVASMEIISSNRGTTVHFVFTAQIYTPTKS